MRIGFGICVRAFAAMFVAALNFPHGGAAEGGSRNGFHYYRDAVADVPWSIQVLKIDRSHPGLEFHTTVGNGQSIALVPLPDQIARIPADLGKPIAAINGDYYLDREPYLGDPKGLQISRGELISAPCDWTSVWIDTNGEPRMERVSSRLTVTWPDGTVTPMGLNEPRPKEKVVLFTKAVGFSTQTSGGVEYVLEKGSSPKWMPLQVGEEYSAVVRSVHEKGNSATSPDSMVLSVGAKAMRNLPKLKKGSVVRISTATQPSLIGVETAIGGGPALLHEGKVQVGWSAFRHPRSAIGWNKDHIYMVQVDGRQRGFSVGMTYAEMANYMLKLGCDEAVNLDGGGSATFWALGQVMNSPSEGKARGIANALVIMQKPSNATISTNPETLKPAAESAE